MPAARHTQGEHQDPFHTVATHSVPVSVPASLPATTPRPGSKSYLWILAAVGALLLIAIIAIPVVNWFLHKADAETLPTTGPAPSATVAAPTVPEGMVAIPGGSYLMGRNLTDDEKTFEAEVQTERGPVKDKPFTYDYPAHEASVGAFFLDRTEVSNREYAKFVTATNRPPPPHWKGAQPPADAESIPVTFVTFLDAQDFCTSLGKTRADGFTYRASHRGGMGICRARKGCGGVGPARALSLGRAMGDGQG
jgi:formylglycine-generating enzyme required for sulfatase activity